MDKITSRKNPLIAHIRKLSASREYRSLCGEYVCEGATLLDEARASSAEITSVIWCGSAGAVVPGIPSQYEVPEDLYSFISPLKNSPGPLFTVKIQEPDKEAKVDSAVVLENIQDPGNIGTVLRTANAFGIGSVVLTGSCADLYNSKTVRASMGAIFRQRTDLVDLPDLRRFVDSNALTLYAAVLSDKAEDIRNIDCSGCAFAIGNEGSGLSRELLGLCDNEVIIPMSPSAESLNAAVAAGILMWEVKRREK
ncbi:MAG: RNA methyltransferase [Oscillospiraceae bacterium]|nr:RNA methyltransferase [Oscillospiraceae bacterium]